MVRYIALALFLVVVVGGGALIGASNVPGEWYQALDKPPFNPPDWLFAPVWTALYVMIAVAGWRIWVRRDTHGAMSVWWLQLGLNFLWSPVFFSLRSPDAALLVISLLLVSILAFIRLTWERDRIASVLFMPYAAWVAFAAVLNASIWWLN